MGAAVNDRLHHQPRHGVFFWAHLVLVFGFLVYLGDSKHLHIVTAAVNVVLREEKPKERLRPIDIDAVMSALDASDQHFGAVAREHFSWKDVLDLYSCTECAVSSPAPLIVSTPSPTRIRTSAGTSRSSTTPS
jgi:hypothetical protein